MISLVIIFWNIKYEQICQTSFNGQSSEHMEFLDHFMEEIHILSENSQNNKISKLRLMGILEGHIRECNNKNCLFRRDTSLGSYLDQNYQIEKGKIIKIINNFFTLALSHAYYKVHVGEREFMSLKFYTFLSNFQDNPVRGYFELKSMLHKEKNKESNSSLLFRLLSKIISRNIEELILQYLDQSGNRLESNKTFSTRNEYLNSISLFQFEKFKDSFVKKFREVLLKKIVFWEELIKGCESLDEGHKYIIDLIDKVKVLREDFNNDCRELEGLFGDKENVIYLKMLSIYNIVIMNDKNSSYKIENKIMEIKKRDAVSSKENLTAISIIKGLSTVLGASVLEETGRIIGGTSEKQARIFGYEKSEFSTLTHINQLMPPSISDIHHILIKDYITTGKSKMIRSSRVVQALDKEKFMFPIKLFLNYNFEHTTNFVILAVITRLDTTFANLLCDHNGLIDGVSRNFYEALGMNPTYAHSIILGKCNILLLIPSLFEKITIKNFEKLASDKDQYFDLLVNERMEIIIPADIKSYVDNFRNNGSIKSMKTKWRSKNFLRKIENYISETEKEAKISRKIIIMNMKCRSLSFGDGSQRVFYHLEISEIYTENQTTTFMTHNTFAVTATKNDSVDDGILVVSDRSLKKQQGMENKLLKTLQSIQDRKEQPHSFEKIPDKRDTSLVQGNIEIKVDPASSSRGVKSSEFSRKDENQAYLPSDFQEESSFIYSQENENIEAPLETRRDPFQRATFRQEVVKNDDDFDPRHEESIPIMENINKEELNKPPSFLEDELGRNKPEEDSAGEEDKSSSSERAKVNQKKEDLLKVILKAKTLKSNTTKNRIDDDEQLFQKSVHSSSSMKTSYGSAFLKEIMNNFKYPKLLKYLRFIGIIETTFFLSINIIYVFLIINRLSDFKINVDKMPLSGTLTQTYTRALTSSNLQYIIKQNFTKNLTDEDVALVKKIEDSSFEDLRDFLYFKQEPSIIPLFHSDFQVLVRVQDLKIYYEKTDKADFLDILLNKLRNHQLQTAVQTSENEQLEDYLFFRLNFLETSLASDIIVEKYLNLGTDDISSVRLFYLIITIVGLTTAVFLQLLNLPFLRVSFTYMQKIILLITRITAVECRSEIKNLRKFADVLNSGTDEFLNCDFLNDNFDEDGIAQRSRLAQEQSRNKKATIYLSSKMSIQKLRTWPKYSTILVLVFVVSLYFSGLLIFLNDIENQLKFSVNMNHSLMKFLRNMNNVQCEFNILLSSQYLKENEYSKSDEQSRMLDHFQIGYRNLKEYRSELLIANMMTQTPSVFKETLDYILNEDICLYFKLNYCDRTKENIYKAGILGLLSYWIAECEELISILTQASMTKHDIINRFFAGEKLKDRIITTYTFIDLSRSLNHLYTEIINEGIFEVQNKLLILFIFGGLGCSILLIVLFTILFLNIQRDLIFTRMGLLLIPYKKLTDETVVYLMKNLENI